MKLPVIIGARFTILMLIVLAGILVTGVTGEMVTGKGSSGTGMTPVVDAPLLDSMGISAADQQVLTRQAKELSDRYKNTNVEGKAAPAASGTYHEDSVEKITTSDGKPFEGGTTIDYTISPDNQVSGKVAFKFIEQGWTIKVKGTVTGYVTPDTGKLVMKSNDAFVKYSGKQYPLTMDVNARYDGSGFVGTKQLSIAGTTGTLGFQSNKV